MKLLAVLLVLLSGAISPAVAHHSAAMYEPTKTLVLEGIVKEFQWTNPHVVIWLVRQLNADGITEEWSIETTSPGVLTRSGWTRKSLLPGVRISAVISPLRDGAHGGLLNSLTIDGTGQVLLPGAGKEAPNLR